METLSKTCDQCGESFSITYRVTKAYWRKRRFCSNKCQTASLIGKISKNRGRVKKTLSQRFWEKVIRAADEECWIWSGAVATGGYGKLGNRNHAGGDLKAHRVSYEINKGPIPLGMCVCHTCDNPPCVNPSHLFLGSLAENNYDRENKGRGSDKHGANNPRARLTAEIVKRIRALRAKGLSQQAIGIDVDFPQTTISKIIRGVGWIPE